MGEHALSYKMAMGGAHCENAVRQVVQQDCGVARRRVVRHAECGGRKIEEALAHTLVPLGRRSTRTLYVLERRSTTQRQVEAMYIVIYNTPSAT